MPCTTVTVDAPDESEASLSNVSASLSDSTLELSFDLANNVVSGNGVTISAQVEATIDGERVWDFRYERSPGESATETPTVPDLALSPGDYQVCVNVIDVQQV